MPYDRGGMTILPNIAATGAAIDALFDIAAASATDEAGAITMRTKGRVLGLAYILSEAITCDTTAGVLAIHINDVEVMTVGLVDDEAVDTWYTKLGTLASGQNGEFKAGDVLKVELKTALVDAGTETGIAQIFPMVAMDQQP